MEEWPFHDGNVHNLLESRHIDIRQNRHDVDNGFQMHSSLIGRLSLERELEGHRGCVNAVAWNSNGSLLISGSDDELINIWSYSGRKLLHSIETGHSANIFCTKFIPETSDELVVSGAGDAEVRLFNLSHLNGRGLNDGAISPSALYQCHTRRVKKLAGHSSLHLTHVTFSPNGEEVLLSYSGEHVYLMNINHASGSLMQYSSGDASKLMTFTPVLNRLEHQPLVSNVFQNGLQRRNNIAARIEKCRMLVEMAKRSLQEGTNIFHAIEACNEVFDGHATDIGPTLRHECFCTRAALLLKRKWKNDAHIAVRDCHSARRIDSSSFRAHYCMAEALQQLGKHKEALDFAVSAQCLSPSDNMAAEKVENLKKHLAAAEAEKNNKASDVVSKSEPRTGRVLSLSDILYRSEANSDASQDGLRSEREDSDYDEELELDFETSISGDEGRDVESNILHGSLNLRIQRRVDSTRATCGNGSFASPSSSSQTDRAAYQPEAVIDMKQRYVGHCNVGTDIKQASFLGQRGEYVASGSDDGRWFIWEKRTGRLIKMLLGDDAVVNCVQCHPFDCFVATSGIDNTIKLWTAAGGSAGPETSVLEAMESNQRKLCHNREAFLNVICRPFELLERFRMQEFSEGPLHPFECAQS
ncbi:WD and tetratricopeptide repeats protein 1-like isoform X8 [Durio zibethinus]|uniref:WD and tetratricopeptide repeats protein 1-like isoform X8 n=1 Tax=Durio zibethinus TaxID=66656 RepID=A0A6P5Y5U0_DURZI|nr:WD and tetratricopeptide repeats protein 1-like isoform X8 [Durio zibethinus]